MKFFGRDLDPRDMLQTAVFGGSLGGGMLMVEQLIAREPRMVIETFRQWGPLSVLCLVGLAMLDRGFRSVVSTMEKSSASQQELADAVNKIAQRDSADAYEQRVLMGHIGTQTEKILTRFDELDRRLTEMERSTPASRERAREGIA